MTINGTGGLYTVKQAAALLSVSHWTIHEHIRRKQVKTVRIGTTILLSLDELADLRVPLRVLRG
jgi:excisionase family DNA binding protein